MTSIQSNTEYDYNTSTVQMGFRRKSNDLFESVSQNTFPFLSTNKMFIMAGIHKMPCRTANREDPDQTASSEVV